jgi:hypothetical protein
VGPAARLNQLQILAVVSLSLLQRTFLCLEFAIQHWTNGMPHDVLDDIIRRVIVAGRFAFPLAVFEVDLALVDDRQRLLDLPGGLVDFLPFFLRDGEPLPGDPELELLQPFIDAAPMPHPERFEVDKHQRLRAVLHVAGQPVESKSEIAIWDGIGGEELTTVRLLAQQTAVIGRHVEFVGALIDDGEQLLQSVVEFC